MRKAILGFAAVWVMGVAALGVAQAADKEGADQPNPLQALGWQRGPLKSPLSGKAVLTVPADASILNEADSSKFLELTGNMPSTGLNIVAGKSWWATFEFDEVGYVKDDEKIDADALLKQMKADDGPSNEARRKRGLSELITEGWHIPPHYDSTSKHLEWALRLHSSDRPTEPIINYTVRLLGRTGYERVVLVSHPESLDADVKAFKAALTGFDFNAGEKYSEFKKGDRVAEFGLAALVAGGAAAVLAKTGLWKVLLGFLAAGWKFVALGVVALFAGIGKFFSRGSSK
jgi:uncharacterized membrane-anchored protein